MLLNWQQYKALMKWLSWTCIVNVELRSTKNIIQSLKESLSLSLSGVSKLAERIKGKQETNVFIWKCIELSHS